jgi:hypothetical protein
VYSLEQFGLKIAVFWDVMPFDSCKNRRYRGTYSLRHQDGKNGDEMLTFLHGMLQLLVSANVVPSSLIPFTLFLPKRRFLQEPRDITSQKMVFFVVTAVKTAPLTLRVRFNPSVITRY